MREKTPLEWPVFHRAVETLITLRGPDLLRIKGLLNLKGSKGPVVFQAVQHLIHPPVELSAWPDKDHGSRVVFITRGVSEKQVRDLFDACKALGYVHAANDQPHRVPATRKDIRADSRQNRSLELAVTAVPSLRFGLVSFQITTNFEGGPPPWLSSRST